MGRVAEKLQPRPEYLREGNHQENDPVPGRQRHACDQQVADQHDAFPSGIGTPPLRVAFGEEHAGPPVFGHVTGEGFELKWVVISAKVN